MITVIYDHMEYSCYHAAKSETDIVLYDENYEKLYEIRGIDESEWNYIQIIDGEWEELEPDPTPEEIIQNKMDQMQADLDFCLMLLDEM